MGRRKVRDGDIACRLMELACGRANDVMKLALLEPGDYGALDQLDLTMLAEMRRTEKGLVEVKLHDRIRALELLTGLLEERGGRKREREAEMFFEALEQAAVTDGTASLS